MLHGLGIEDRHLVAGLENAWAGGSRFEKVGSQNFNGKWSNWLPVEIFFSSSFLHPKASLGPKVPKIPTQEPPQK